MLSKPSRQTIYARSRDKSFLLRWCFIIMGACLGITLLCEAALPKRSSYQAEMFHPEPGKATEMFAQAFLPWAGDPNLNLRDAADWLLSVSKHPEMTALFYQKNPTLEESIGSLQTLSDGDKKRLLLLLHALHPRAQAGAGKEARKELEDITSAMPLPALAFEMLGHALQARQPLEALKAYQVQIALDNSPVSRREALQVALAQGKTELVRAMRDDPKNRDIVEKVGTIEIALALRDYGRVISGYAQDYLRDWSARYSPGIVFLAIFNGLIWGIILSQLCSVRLGSGWFLPFLLGAASAVACGLVVYVQDFYWTLRPAGSPLNVVAYYVFSVGLREELLKLLFFLPLIPWLLHKKSDQLALFAASMVGLGFAVEENLNYFMSDSSSSLGRFLTANFMHVALTGTVGYALYAMVRRWREWTGFLEALLIAIVAHGLYDALPGLNPDVAYFGFVVYIFIAWRFFTLLRQHGPARSPTLSPLAVLVLGISVIMGVTMIVYFFDRHFFTNLGAYGMAMTGNLVVMFLFIHEYRDV